MLNTVKTAVFVSGNGSNLQALIDSKKNGGMEHVEIALVISSKLDSYALKRAELSHVDSVVVERKKYKNDIYGFEKEIIPHLQSHNIQLIVLAGFLTVFSEDFIGRYENRIINVHPALIPSFCGKGFYGLKVHEAALEYGVKVSGATVHYVDETVDGGRIILQKAVDVIEGDTPETLQKRILEEAEWILLPEATEIAAKRILEINDD
jgi:phosphoribosylglycinamide formyltransferase-1